MEIYGSSNNWNLQKSSFGSVNILERLLDVTAKREDAVSASPNWLAASDKRGQGVDNFYHVMRMRQAIEAMRPMMVDSEIEVSISAAATSAASLDLGIKATATTLQSTEEINATSVPHSISTTAPAATGSTALATISGSYDGSSGTGTLTFKVIQGGEHGTSDLQYKVYDSSNSVIEQIDISAADPAYQQYTLANGMTLELGEGSVLVGDTFTVDVEAPEGELKDAFEGQFSQSTAAVTIGGEYDGSNGPGPLRFKVTEGGTHGEDSLKIKVFDSDNNRIKTITLQTSDDMDKVYSLGNGLTLSLGEGDLVKNDEFTMDLYDTEPIAIESTTPEYAGSSAGLTLGGTYDGSNGGGELTFKVTSGGTHGTHRLTVKVFDPNNLRIDTINIEKTDPADKAYELSNGLTLSVGEGKLLKNDVFTINVSEGNPGVVNPGKPLNGISAEGPNLETGLSVTNGSFQINGVDIAVQEDDTINTVLDRINQSEAGVTATFDAATEKILLTQNTPGAASDIRLENDTSGFLAAMKLDGAVAIPGEGQMESEALLSNVEQFSSVQSGTISVNSVAISIDVNTDSLTDVLERITASGAGVTASFDSTTQRVSLRSDNSDSQLILDSGSTNFSSAVQIADGAYNPSNDTRQVQGIHTAHDPEFAFEYAKTYATDSSNQETGAKSVNAVDSKMLGEFVNIIASSMNTLFGDESFASSPFARTEETRNMIRSAVSATFGSEGPQYDTDFGIHFDFQNTKKGVFNFSDDDQRQFESAFSTPEGGDAVRSALFGDDSKGLFDQLHGALTAAIPDQVGKATGLFLDIVV